VISEVGYFSRLKKTKQIGNLFLVLLTLVVGFLSFLNTRVKHMGTIEIVLCLKDTKT
jgi:hypothetical protein